MTSKTRKTLTPSFVESLEPRKLLSTSPAFAPPAFAAAPSVTSATTVHPFAYRITAATRLIIVALPSASVLMGQPLTLAAKLTAGGLPLHTSAIKFTDSRGNLIGTATTTRSGYASIVIPNAFVGSYSIRAVYAGLGRYLASQSGLIAVKINPPTFTTAPNGLKTATTVAGSGQTANNGNTVAVNYTGYLTNGTLFDTSLKAGRTPLSFVLGAHSVIAGFEQGVTGMKVGETRVLVIPPSLGYGSTANGNIPANSTLVFIVSLVSVS